MCMRINYQNDLRQVNSQFWGRIFGLFIQSGRNPLVLDHAAIVRDRQHGQSLRQVARGHRISTATVQLVLRKHPAQVPVPALEKIA